MQQPQTRASAVYRATYLVEQEPSPDIGSHGQYDDEEHEETSGKHDEDSYKCESL